MYTCIYADRPTRACICGYACVYVWIRAFVCGRIPMYTRAYAYVFVGVTCSEIDDQYDDDYGDGSELLELRRVHVADVKVSRQVRYHLVVRTSSEEAFKHSDT